MQLKNIVENKHNQFPRNGETVSFLSLNNNDPRKSSCRKLNTFQKLESKKNMKLENIDSKSFYRKLKTLNFEIKNESSGITEEMYEI